MIYIIHKMLVLLKNYLNYLKDDIFECFFKKYNRLLFVLKKQFFTLQLKTSEIFLDKKKKLKQLKILRDTKNLFEHEEKYYKPVRVSVFWSNNYIEYENNGDRNKTLSVEEYLNKIRPYLKDIINNVKKTDA